jgi:photosystem II stability/assembly factor-like uncharacterized protein
LNPKRLTGNAGQPFCSVVIVAAPSATTERDEVVFFKANSSVAMIKRMKRSTQRSFSLILLVLTALCTQGALAAETAWLPVGPDGGDARSFAADASNPKHIYLGTTNSWIYQSQDGGSSWKRLAKLSKTDDLIVDNILVDSTDPKTLFVATWVVDHPDGGLFISSDQGAHWKSVEDMQGQSIRALAQSASDPKTLIAGTLKGVYRSEDKGLHWKLISPTGSMELHEVESIAIDPTNPQTIYAGTWHLPWKTTDGGANWHNIKQGIIDDSDVFSIIIDPKMPTNIYASACSGIYKSETSGELFKKVQGIPSTARRTRVLMQDPVNRSTVYAGTTEGLYRTTAAGVNWQRLTGPDVIINDVYVDPSNPQHVLLATDRSGVLESSDGAISFKGSNAGFSQRQVATILLDAKNPKTIFAGVLNDKSYGGVFISQDNGQTWQQRSNGLEGRDVFSFGQTKEGKVLAGTSHGILQWDGATWQPTGKVVNSTEKTTYKVVKGKRVPKVTTVSSPPTTIEARVNKISATEDVWYAASAEGIYLTSDQGATWQGPLLKGLPFIGVASSGTTAFAARRESLAVSEDSGKTWDAVPLPTNLTAVRVISTTPNGILWLGGREGMFFSENHGKSWKPMDNLPFRDVNGMNYDAELKRLLVTSWRSTWVLAVSESDRTFKYWDCGWAVHSVRSSGGRLVGASLFDGVIMQSNESAVAATGSN